MEVAKSTPSRWSFLEELQEVSVLSTNLDHVCQTQIFESYVNTPLNFVGGSLASDELYLLDLRNGDQAA